MKNQGFFLIVELFDMAYIALLPVATALSGPSVSSPALLEYSDFNSLPFPLLMVKIRISIFEIRNKLK